MNDRKASLPAREPLKLSLLQNGVDFVQAAVILLYSDDKLPLLAHKYAVLNIFSGALLLLKERLSREHRSLIWVDVTKVDSQGERTVDFVLCLERLSSIAKVKLDESQTKLLRRAQKHRNRIEHYGVELNPHEAENLVAEMVEFIFVFMRDQLGQNLEDDLPDDAWTKVQQLRSVAQRLQEEHAAVERGRIADAEQRYQEAIKSVGPKKWWQRAHPYMVMPSTDLEALVEDHDQWDPHDSPPAPALQCDECESDSVVVVEDGVAICTNPDCRSPHTAHSCPRCGGATVLDGAEDDYCESCENEIAEMIKKD